MDDSPLHEKIGALAWTTYRRKPKRAVDGLRACEWRAPRKAARPKGLGAAARAGIKYEAEFADHLLENSKGYVRIGPWIYFEDANGWGYCQPDMVLNSWERIYLFECKLSFTYRRAYKEMRDLYKPLLHELFGGAPITCVQVCRHLKPSAKRTTVVHELDEVFECPKTQLTLAWVPSIL
jgi:hypothetical protein